MPQPLFEPRMKVSAVKTTKGNAEKPGEKSAGKLELEEIFVAQQADPYLYEGDEGLRSLFRNRLRVSIRGALALNLDQKTKLNDYLDAERAVSLALSLEPVNEAECAFAVQAALAHEMALECLKRSQEAAGDIKFEEYNLKMNLRCMKAYNGQVQALMNYRKNNFEHGVRMAPQIEWAVEKAQEMEKQGLFDRAIDDDTMN